MNYEVEIQNIKARLDSLQESFIQFGINNNDTVNKTDDTANKVVAITPYTDTKTAYCGDTEVIFDGAPYGNLSVFFSNYNSDFSVYRTNNRIIISFPAVEEVTDVTISVQ